MRCTCKLVMTSAVVAAGLALASPARAALLAEGTTIPATAVMAPSGSTLASLTQSDSSRFGAAATLTTEVIADSNNPFGAGLLSFTYRYTNTGTSSFGRVAQFFFDAEAFTPGLLVDVGFVAPTMSNAEIPDLFDRDFVGNVGAVFLEAGNDELPPSGTGKLGPGEVSVLLVIRTNATSFIRGGASAINGGALEFDAFQPSVTANPIPEPGTLAMAFAALPLLGLGAYYRRRRSSQS